MTVRKRRRRGRRLRPLRSAMRAALTADRGAALCSVCSVSESAACRHDSAGSLNPPIQRSSSSSTAVQMRDDGTTAHAPANSEWERERGVVFILFKLRVKPELYECGCKKQMETVNIVYFRFSKANANVTNIVSVIGRIL